MIFRRALLRELTTNAIYIFVVLVAILVTQFLIKLIGAASAGTLPTDGLIPLVGFRLISQLPPLIVIAMFTSILLTLSRAWRDSEMAIWMSSGQSLMAWVRPVLTFAGPLLVIALVLSTVLSPWAERRSIEYRRLLDSRDELSLVAPGLFQEMRKTHQVYFVEGVNLIDGKIKNVFVFADDPNGQWLTRATEGRVCQPSECGERYVILENGNRVKRLSKQSAPAEYELASFARYGVRMGDNEVRDDPLEERAKDTLTLLREATPTGLGQVFYRLSVPLAGIAFAMLAIPLAYVNPRLGRSINLLMAILLLMSGLQVMNIVQSLIDRRTLTLPVALFVFHVTLIALVAAAFYRRYRGAVFGGALRWLGARPEPRA